jgi:spore maturation protein CgeB
MNSLRILILGGTTLQGSLEFFYMDAFKRLGHEVIGLGYRDLVELSNHWLHVVLRNLGASSKRLREILSLTMFGSYTTFSERVLRAFDPDMILVFKGEMVSRRLLRILAESGARLVYYNPDDPRYGGLARGFVDEGFLIATPCVKCVRIYTRWDARKAILLPFASSTYIPRNTRIDRKARLVLFIGSMYPGRLVVVRRLLMGGLPLALAGPGWPFKTKPLYGEAYEKIHRISLIGLNIHVRSDLGFKANMRTFEIAGLGALELTDNCREVSRYYVPGKEIICYEDPEDLIEKAKYFLDNPEDAYKIAREGIERTIREHLYVHRASYLISNL